jgi:hypothetical protein
MVLYFWCGECDKGFPYVRELKMVITTQLYLSKVLGISSNSTPVVRRSLAPFDSGGASSTGEHPTPDDETGKLEQSLSEDPQSGDMENFEYTTFLFEGASAQE